MSSQSLTEAGDGWLIRFSAEIDRAQAARARGNEGMARVCSRRAAGILIDEYLSRRDQTSYPHPVSAYECIKLLSRLPDISVEIKHVATHFIQSVTPEHTLPVFGSPDGTSQAPDLIAEALWLSDQLLGEESQTT